MRLSVFNLYVSDFPEVGTTLIYNSLTGAFLEVDADTLAALRAMDRGELDEVRAAEWVDSSWMDEDAQFVVETREKDEQAWEDWYDTIRQRPGKMSAIVSVTFACNMDCTYCCQSDVLDGTTMKAETASNIVNWLATRAEEIGATSLDISFVGGEPLIQKDRIEKMVIELRARLASFGAELRFGLITNGMFMTRALVERWLPLGMKGAQVTLDGDETTHDLTRRSKKRNEDTYPIIFKNVIDCADLISIRINGNYMEDTVHGFPGLVTQLKAAGLGAKTRITFSPALQVAGSPSDMPTGSCTFSGSNPELMLALNDVVERAGFDAGDPLNLGPCGFHTVHNYAIDPQGHIYKCPGFLGKTEWAIGHAATGLTERYEQMINSRPHKQCGSCANRPDCAGGCVAADWIAAGNADGVNCEKPYFDSQGDALVKRKYAFTVAANDGRDPFELIPPVDAPALTPAGRRSSALRVLAA